MKRTIYVYDSQNKASVSFKEELRKLENTKTNFKVNFHKLEITLEDHVMQYTANRDVLVGVSKSTEIVKCF